MRIRVGILTAPKIEFERRENTFLLRNVRIGIGFHWDRHEDQEFAGTLEIRRNADGTETAINIIDLEDYLCSVISSEMSADSPIELLKAHAVISRSWAMRAIAQRPHEQMVNGQMVNDFDVCADDHCQRYEGLRRQNERAVMAVRATAGQVLVNGERRMANGEWEICDCRYHKCCGGRTEIWRTCWEDINVPYIQSVECEWCNPNGKWKMENGKCLNDYDQETTDFHDWQVQYTQEELSDIIRRKSGIDFGDIIDLVPLHRGASGRIDRLKIVGTKRTETIGKELKIRQWLSPTCLYSSWFDVEKDPSYFVPRHFVLSGHGWGHGAGLCQIGAAVMATEGKTYEEILSYYYHNTQLKIED